jgi:hypothetical protein
MSSSKMTYVIYKTPPKNGPKFALFCLDFRSIFASKPLYIVGNLSYLPFEPLFVIIIIVSTCLEVTKSMDLYAGTPLEVDFSSKKLPSQVDFYAKSYF